MRLKHPDVEYNSADINKLEVKIMTKEESKKLKKEEEIVKR